MIELQGAEASGAIIEAYAWPNSKVLKRLPAGQAVELAALPVTEVSGEATFAVDISGVSRDYLEGNRVNYEVRLHGQTESFVWNGVGTATPGAVDEVEVDLDEEVVVLPDESAVAAAGRGHARKSAGLERPESKLVRMSKRPDARTLRQIAAGDVSARMDPICSVNGTSTYRYGVREIWAGAYGYWGAKVTADFNTGSSHTLGIKAGSSMGGTVSISTSAGASAGGLVDKYVTNKVNYRMYKNTCTGNQTWRPHSFNALLPSGEFPDAPNHNFTASCSQYNPHTSVWKTDVQNVTISNGVVLDGVNLSAQSGWNQESKMRFVVTAKSWICGNTSAGWVRSSQSSAKKV